MAPGLPSKPGHKGQSGSVGPQAGRYTMAIGSLVERWWVLKLEMARRAALRCKEAGAWDRLVLVRPVGGGEGSPPQCSGETCGIWSKHIVLAWLPSNPHVPWSPRLTPPPLDPRRGCGSGRRRRRTAGTWRRRRRGGGRRWGGSAQGWTGISANPVGVGGGATRPSRISGGAGFQVKDFLHRLRRQKSFSLGGWGRSPHSGFPCSPGRAGRRPPAGGQRPGPSRSPGRGGPQVGPVGRSVRCPPAGKWGQLWTRNCGRSVTADEANGRSVAGQGRGGWLPAAFSPRKEKKSNTTAMEPFSLVWRGVVSGIAEPIIQRMMADV